MPTGRTPHEEIFRDTLRAAKHGGLVKPSRVRPLAHGPLTGVWFRAVRQHHFSTALSYAHTATAATRFSPGTTSRSGFPVMYFAENHQVGLFEVAAMVGSPVPGQPALANPKSGPWTVFPVQLTRRKTRPPVTWSSFPPGSGPVA
jgi:hypothetical protein